MTGTWETWGYMSVTSCGLGHSAVEFKKVQIVNFLCSEVPISSLTDKDIFGNAFEWS